jgi:hypothetical protein
VILVGEAGVGKTRLARAALMSAAEEGAALEWAQATRSAATIPLAAFVDLLPPDALGRDPLQLVKASTAALRARANGRRAVLGLDDAHLLDGASAALALHVASTGAAFVVARVRAGEACPDAIVALWKDAAPWPPVQAELLHEALSAGAAARDLAAPLAASAARCDGGVTGRRRFRGRRPPELGPPAGRAQRAAARALQGRQHAGAERHEPARRRADAPRARGRRAGRRRALERRDSRPAGDLRAHRGVAPLPRDGQARRAPPRRARGAARRLGFAPWCC